MISACVITKNEEKNIPRWLECARKLADEMIVVDTGSTDQTVPLALAAGASVFSFSWQDDFSAAKNFAISKAKGEWIAFLDADEYFMDEDIPKVKAHTMRNIPENVLGFVCPLINIDADKGNKIINKGLQIRIFKHRPDVMYHGKLHEMLVTFGRTMDAELVDDFSLYHTGYSSSVVRNKLFRNMGIILAEQKRRGEIWSDAFYLADCYYGLKMYDEAIKYAEQAISSGHVLVGLENRPQEILKSSKILKAPK